MIYADNASTTKISESVLAKMLPFLKQQYGNASNLYSLGIEARRAVEQARRQVAKAIGAEPPEITFTSGGSEANNWVLRVIAEMYAGETVHIITSSIEHPSVLNACRALERKGIECSYLPVSSKGQVAVNDFKSVITPNTKLVSIMLANNEIGTIQPIAQIGQFLRDKGILFHTDAVQAVGHIPVDVNELHVDFLTASAHKFNGAKGTGVLYKRSGLVLPSMIFGGGQEEGQRAGTENVAGIVAAGYAIEESQPYMAEAVFKLKTLADITFSIIKSKIPSARVNGDFDNRLPGLINLGFDNVSGESLMHILDMKGICISTSSACNAGNDEPSHVLLALGQTEQQAKSAIRISYGRFNSDEDAKIVAAAVCDAYERITRIS